MQCQLQRRLVFMPIICALVAPALFTTPATAVTAIPQFDSLKSSVTTDSERKSFLKQLHKEIIEDNLAVPLDAKSEERWESAFWGLELCLYRNETTLNALRHALNTNSSRSDSFTRSALEAACTVYPTELGREVAKVAKQTRNPKNFAMAVHYLLRLHPKKAKSYSELMHRNFANPEQDPWLSQLQRNLEIPFEIRLNSRPPMRDLLRQRFPGDAPVIFSFQRRNRDYPGLTVIRKSDGSFVRRPEGSMFSVPHLARAMSNCPGYLTNGNTPQGIFSIQSIEPADNSFIGPTPALQTVLPIEKSVADYFHDRSKDGTKWDRKLYQEMLPASWREYVPIFEAYAAGEVGRGDIITHGTTIDPEFYKGLTYYPNTPSMGCLTAVEMWSPKDGRCIYSDQLSLIDAYTSLDHPTGFLVVVELDNESRSVYLYDVLPYLLDAESN